ncbi:19886_t:CDS:2 [Funneliformis geosporum]|nr:19886_t:CDS:2 [Funneliformis geosporum]
MEAPTTCETKTTNNAGTSTTSTTNILSARRPLNSSMVYWTAILAATVLLLNLSLINKESLDKPEKMLLMKAKNANIIRVALNIFPYLFVSCVITYFDNEKKNVIFYNCSKQNASIGSGILKNSSNQLDG